jgi:serine/threonine-protein kinase
MRLGKYQLLEQLAIGGMAEVYLARASGIEGFEKLVVLKRILPQFATNEDFVRMFLAEARIAARLHHQNIVQVFDIGATVGNYYFAMQYVYGKDVRDILKAARKAHRRIRLGDAVAIVLGAAAGLHYAHELADAEGRPLGIVHRDVSPSNLLVTFDGCIKLLDFGVAKIAAKEPETTRVGTLKGKVGYMSPEQCRGERLDRRSDVFALGIVLFELTTGTRLFDAESELAVLNKIAHEDAPSPASRRPDYPDALAAIVLRALHRDRAERYQSAQALQRDLDEFARDSRLSVSPLDLAAFMSSLFPEDAARRPASEAWGEERRSGSRPSASRPRALRPADPVAAPEVDDEPSLVIVEAADEDCPTGGARRAAAIAALFVAGAALAVGALVLRTARSDAKPPPAASPPAAAASTLTPPMDAPTTPDPGAGAAVHVPESTAPALAAAVSADAAPAPGANRVPSAATRRKRSPKRSERANPHAPATWDPDSPLPPPR